MEARRKREAEAEARRASEEFARKARQAEVDQANGVKMVGRKPVRRKYEQALAATRASGIWTREALLGLFCEEWQNWDGQGRPFAPREHRSGDDIRKHSNL